MRGVGKRLDRLEVSPVFASPELLMKRITRALDQAYLRAGKRPGATDVDEATRARIFEDVHDRFTRHLTDRELDISIAALKAGLSPAALKTLEEGARQPSDRGNPEETAEW